MLETQISVRGLVEFVYRSGDLDLRFSGKSKMTDGIKVHQKIQASQGIDYEAEVSLKKVVKTDEVALKISGRADGILHTSEGVVIDEIKGTSQWLDKIDEMTFPVHWAQAKIYGYIYAEENALKELTIQLTYVAFETNEVKRLRQEWSFEALKEFFDETVKVYLPWVKYKNDWFRLRNQSITLLDFPFASYRKGQRQLAVSVYNTIKDQQVLFAQAPTGIGKTVSTLFPTIKSMHEGLVDKVFYLAAKNTTKKVAEETVDLLTDRGLMMKSITLTAKDKICFKDKSNCNPEYCEYAKGHFDRVNDALWEALHGQGQLNRAYIEAIAEAHKVCPYEFSLDLALFSDLVICDYNYAFDPRVYLRRFFDVPTEKFVFLVDEAHNLVDRARTMFSAELHKDKIMAIKKDVKSHDQKLMKQIEGINKTILSVRKNCDERGVYVDKDEIEAIYQQLRRRATAIEKWLTQSQGSPIYDQVLDFYFEILSYLRISECYDEGFLFYITQGDKPDTLIKLFCIDPSRQLQRFINNSVATVFFSATLSPMPYYENLLCKSEAVKRLALDSPFEEKHKCVLFSKDVSVKYKERDKALPLIVEAIHEMAQSRLGNYMVFLPSYYYMEQVHEAFQLSYDRDYDIIIQEREMSDEERITFIDTFKHHHETRCTQAISDQKSLICFSVLGGVFSEGIDLKGDYLIGTAIVGVGLPMIQFENDLIRSYFDEINGHGFQYAYQYPGVNKVMQAAGRVIRSESDQGVILLLDNRLMQYYYRKLLPRDWGRHLITKNELSKQLELFWKEALENES